MNHMLAQNRGKGTWPSCLQNPPHAVSGEENHRAYTNPGFHQQDTTDDYQDTLEDQFAEGMNYINGIELFCPFPERSPRYFMDVLNQSLTNS